MTYKYKYNGKEFQDELGLNLYDYGAKNYDPAIGRWMNMDALSEKYPNISNYVYVANMPTIAFDPDGNEIILLHLVELNCNTEMAMPTIMELIKYTKQQGVVQLIGSLEVIKKLKPQMTKFL